jgi:hypothetical protein
MESCPKNSEGIEKSFFRIFSSAEFSGFLFLSGNDPIDIRSAGFHLRSLRFNFAKQWAELQELSYVR